MFYNDLIPLYEQRKRYPRNIYRDYEWPTNLLVDLLLDVRGDGKVHLRTQNCVEPSPQVLPRIQYLLQETLTEREAKAVRLRYEEKLRHREIAERFGISRTGPSQILHKALRKLRHPLRWSFLRLGYGAIPDAYKSGYRVGYEDAKHELTRIDRLEKERLSCAKLKTDEYWKMFSPHETIATTACCTLIEYLDLTVRSFNSLRRHNCKTIRDVLCLTRSEFCKIRNFGVASQAEVINVLKEHGFNVSHLEKPPSA